MCKTQYGITKDDAFKILDNINMWIGNCDGKVSTILAGIGIITAVVFSSDVFITSTCGIDEVGEGEVKGWGIKGLSQAGGFSTKSCQTKI